MKRLASYVAYLFSDESETFSHLKKEVKKIRAVLHVLKPERKVETAS